MLKDNGHIDKMFSDGLKNLSVQPRQELWSNINASVKLARRKKRAAVMFISLAAAASLVLLFTLSNKSLFQNEFQESELFSGLNSTLNQSGGEDISINEKTNVINNKDRNAITAITQTSKKQNNELLTFNKTNKSKLASHRKIVAQMVLPEMQVAEVDKPALNMKLFDKSKDEATLSILSKLKDSLIISRNLKMLDLFDKSESKKKEWSILAQVSSAYSSYKGEKSGGNSEDGLISIGGGVKLNWQANKKLAIQTGVIYNKFGQQLAGAGSVIESAAFSDDVVVKSNLNSRIETSAGNIKMKEQAVLFDSSKSLLPRGRNSSSDMIQSFEAIEIPFILRYSLIDKKFGLHMSGGLSTNLMVGNRVYDKNSRKTLGETSGIRTTNFSTSFSLGIEYQLSSKFRLSMEPAFKYYLNSINKDSNFNYKPYSIGLSSGISYKF